MKAFVQNGYGLSEMLVLTDIPITPPKAKQVLVRVEATSLDAGVTHLMTGDIPLVRLFNGFRAPRTRPGICFSGTITGLGSQVSEYKLGQKVFGTSSGTFAEYVVARQDKIAVLPDGFDMSVAATLPVSASTALQAVRDLGRVRPGQRVLITGASGGVGSFAVQLAVHMGGTVTGVCGTEKIDFVQRLGVSRVIDYRVDEISGTYDVIIDIASPLSLSRTRQLLAPGGRLVIIGVASKRGSSGMARNLGANITSLFSRESLVWLLQSENSADLVELANLVTEARLVSVVEKTFPFEQTPEAVEYFASGKCVGKTVLLVGSNPCR